MIFDLTTALFLSIIARCSQANFKMIIRLKGFINQTLKNSYFDLTYSDRKQLGALLMAVHIKV